LLVPNCQFAIGREPLFFLSPVLCLLANSCRLPPSLSIGNTERGEAGGMILRIIEAGGVAAA